MSSSRFRKVLRILFQGLILLLLTGLLTEVAFRVLHRLSPVFIFPSATYHQFRAKPLAEVFGFKLNSLGFKDVEFEARKRPGTFRILGIGDSFVYGIVPYEDNFLTVLEDDLARRPVPVEILNMGIPRTGVDDYLSLLVNEGLRFAPDMVIVCFYVGNDFNLREEPPPRSYLLAFLRYVFRILPQVDDTMRYRQKAFDETTPTISVDAYRQILKVKLELFRKKRPSFVDSLEGVASSLEKIRQICDHHQLRFLTVIIPDEIQVDAAVRRSLTATLPYYRDENFDYQLPNRRLAAELDRRGVAYLDLLPAFLAAGAHTQLYKPRDTHWNISGNRLAAQEIAAALADGGWLPESVEAPLR